MQTQKFYHKCGYPILVVKKPVGPAEEIFFVDGSQPFIEGKDGSKKPRILKQCPECAGTIRQEKLLSSKPAPVEDKRPSGYIPAGR